MNSTSRPPTPHTVIAADGTIVVHVHRHESAPDELVAYPFGLEREAARRLMRDGHLPAARIGRRVYARRSDVLALVERLAATTPATPAPTEPRAAYLALVGAGSIR